MRAKLSPPNPPAFPGEFDFARQAWFNRLGAVGFALGTPKLITPAEPGLWAPWQDTIARWRNQLSTELQQKIGGPEGAIATALTTGQRTTIPTDLLAAYQASGLMHLISISGLHMSLVAGVVFFFFRGTIALVPPLALHVDSKKLAAIGAFIVMGGYLLLSGNSIPAQRSFVMGSTIMVAILLNRSAITLRTLATAAAIVLAIQPEALIDPSFQMSFAAVLALGAAYEGLSPAFARLLSHTGKKKASLVSRLAWGAAFYTLSLVVSSLIASLATAPYAAYHFHRFTPYGLAANMIAVPLASFLVMPGLILALFLMPLGADGLVYPLIRWGLATIANVAQAVASWPEALMLIPPLGTADLALITVGGLWICLWRQAWRWGGLVLIALGCTLPFFRPAPVAIVADQAFALHGASGFVFTPDSGNRFLQRAAARRWGDSTESWPPSVLENGSGLSCDSLGCLLRLPGTQVAFSRTPQALVEDCAQSQIVVNLTMLRPRSCAALRRVDFAEMRRSGTALLFIDDAGEITRQSVKTEQGQRPWSPRTASFPPQRSEDD